MNYGVLFFVLVSFWLSFSVVGSVLVSPSTAAIASLVGVDFVVLIVLVIREGIVELCEFWDSGCLVFQRLFDFSKSQNQKYNTISRVPVHSCTCVHVHKHTTYMYVHVCTCHVCSMCYVHVMYVVCVHMYLYVLRTTCTTYVAT